MPDAERTCPGCGYLALRVAMARVGGQVETYLECPECGVPGLCSVGPPRSTRRLARFAARVRLRHVDLGVMSLTDSWTQQRAFLEAKLTAWIILDRLDVAFAEKEGFNPTGSFKDRGMAIAISPVPARLDAVLAQLGL